MLTNRESVNNLKKVDALRCKSLKKIASGKNISSASDNASGLAISEKMKAQIRGLNQANKNIQDAVSLLQVAEGGVATINDSLQRVRDLVVQFGTDTTSEGDREIICKEIESLLDCVDDVGNTTSFNGINLLNGTDSFGSMGVGLAPHPIFEIEGVDYTLIPPDYGVNISMMPSGANTYVTVSLGYTTYSMMVPSLTGDGSLEKGEITLISSGYPDITLKVKEKTNVNTVIKVVKSLSCNLDSQVGANNEVLAMQIPNVTLDCLGLNKKDVGSLKDGSMSTNAFLNKVDSALFSVGVARTAIGLYGNRLDIKGSYNENRKENLSSTNSRIEDVDIAKELVRSSKLNMLSNLKMYTVKNKLSEDVVNSLLKM